MKTTITLWSAQDIHYPNTAPRINVEDRTIGLVDDWVRMDVADGKEVFEFADVHLVVFEPNN